MNQRPLTKSARAKLYVITYACVDNKTKLFFGYRSKEKTRTSCELILRCPYKEKETEKGGNRRRGEKGNKKEQ